MGKALPDQGEMIQMLKDHGISLTQQRLVVLRCVLEAQGHPDAEAIFAAVRDMDQVISRATVYNTLNLFEAKGMISSLDIDGHTHRFDRKTKPHGHFLCQRCGAIFNFKVSGKALHAALPGFWITKRDVYFKGICPACQEGEARVNFPADQPSTATAKEEDKL